MGFNLEGPGPHFILKNPSEMFADHLYGLRSDNPAYSGRPKALRRQSSGAFIRVPIALLQLPRGILFKPSEQLQCGCFVQNSVALGMGKWPFTHFHAAQCRIKPIQTNITADSDVHKGIFVGRIAATTNRRRINRASLSGPSPSRKAGRKLSDFYCCLRRYAILRK